MTKLQSMILNLAIFTIFIMAIWGPETVKWLLTGFYLIAVKRYYGASSGNSIIGSHLRSDDGVLYNFLRVKK